MAYTPAALAPQAASERFDVMLENATQIPFAKQPIIDRSTGQIVGYSGVAWYDFEGGPKLEFGYRLIEASRGKGYATEAGSALLVHASRSFSGTIYAMIDPANLASQNVARKLGFIDWKQALVDGDLTNLYRLPVEPD